MEGELNKRLKKSIKNKSVQVKLDTIRITQNEIYSKVLDLLKIKSDTIKFISQPIKKTTYEHNSISQETGSA